MTDNNHGQLLPIGEFARVTGLTTSALRFYADTGVLDPADIDPFSGYRLYDPSQISAGIRIRQLRDANMPLTGVRDVLTSSPEDAAKVVRLHIANLTASAGNSIAVAERIAEDLAGDRQAEEPSTTCTMAGPVLAAGLDAALPTTVDDPDLPVLGSVLIEVTAGDIRLVATDRYRLIIRTLVTEATGTDWSGAVRTSDLVAALPELRRADEVRLDCCPGLLRATVSGGHLSARMSSVINFRVTDDEFPDHHLMIESLPDPVARITVDTVALRQAMENAGPRVTMDVSASHLTVGDISMDALVEGTPTRATFSLSTLYPALTGALGPEVVLDFRAADQPVTIRSALRGDLTSLIMPLKVEDE